MCTRQAGPRCGLGAVGQADRDEDDNSLSPRKDRVWGSGVGGSARAGAIDRGKDPCGLRGFWGRLPVLGLASCGPSSFSRYQPPKRRDERSLPPHVEYHVPTWERRIRFLIARQPASFRRFFPQRFPSAACGPEPPPSPAPWPPPTPRPLAPRRISTTRSSQAFVAKPAKILWVTVAADRGKPR